MKSPMSLVAALRRGFSSVLNRIRGEAGPVHEEVPRPQEEAQRPAPAAESTESAASLWRHVLSSDGISVRYRDSGPRMAPPIIFIHGLGCNASVWERQIPAFEGEYRVAALDLPGFGGSGKAPDNHYSMDVMAHAVHAVAKAIESEQGGHASRPVLVGHSMGFAVLRRYLMLYPGSVRAIANVDGFFFRSRRDAVVYSGLKSVMNVVHWPLLSSDARHNAASEEFITYSFYGHTPEAIQAEVRAMMEEADPEVMKACWQGMTDREQWAHYSFSPPALLIYSRAPHVLPDQQAWFRTVFPGLTYEEWDDTGHYLMMEKPERFNQKLASFLQNAGVR